MSCESPRGVKSAATVRPTREALLRTFTVADTTDRNTITHTLMNGRPFPGKWCIPFKAYWQFLCVLPNHIFERSQPAFISERESIQYFMDLDFELLLAQGDHAFLEFVYDLVMDCIRETEVGRQRCRGPILSSTPGKMNKIHLHGDFI